MIKTFVAAVATFPFLVLAPVIRNEPDAVLPGLFAQLMAMFGG